jgi:hypothetical protein
MQYAVLLRILNLITLVIHTYNFYITKTDTIYIIQTKEK